MPNQTPIIDYSIRRVASSATTKSKHTRATSVALPLDDGPESDFDEFAQDDDDDLPVSSSAPPYLGSDVQSIEDEPINNSTTFKFLSAPDDFLSPTTVSAPHDPTFVSLPPIRPMSHLTLSPSMGAIPRAPLSVQSMSEYDDEEEVEREDLSRRDSIVKSVNGYSNGNGTRKASVPKSVMSVKSTKSVNGRSVVPVGDLTAQDRHYLNKIFASYVSLSSY